MKGTFIFLPVLCGSMLLFSNTFAIAQTQQTSTVNSADLISDQKNIPSNSSKTESYSLDLIFQSLKEHDVETFNRYVNTGSVLSSIFDDYFEFTIEKENYNIRRSDSDLAKDKQLEESYNLIIVPKLENYLAHYVDTGSFSTEDKILAPFVDALKKSTDLGYLEFKKISLVTPKNNTAYVDISLFDKLVNKEFTVTLEMQQLEDGTWSLLKISNLKNFIDECIKAKKPILAELNQPIINKINQDVSIGSPFETKIVYIPKLTSCPKLEVHLPISINTENNDFGFLLGHIDIENSTGKLLITSDFSVGLKDQNSPFTHTLIFSLDNMIFGKKYIESDPSALKFKISVTSLTYLNGDKLSIAKDLPENS
jgi:hypothetical protein